MRPASDRYGSSVDAAFDLAPTDGPGPLRKAGQSVVIFAGLFVFGLFLLLMMRLVYWMAPGELIWPIPADAWAAVVFLTVLLVLLGAYRFVARGGFAAAIDRPSSRRGSPADALIGGPIILLITLSASARFGVQVAGFAGLRPVDVPITFVVLDTDSSSSHGTRRYWLRLRYGTSGRTFSDRVSEAVYDAAHAGDTVALPVETGRFGLQRAMVATPLAVADIHHASVTPGG